MKEDKLDHTRQQYLKRALSILVRCSEFDAVTSSSLDILCNVGILYMQSMFSQVHAYAEHATRTRPNMNDVGRALEERHVSVSQLDAYYRSEMDARQQSPIGSATSELCRQAALLTSSSLDSTRVSRESSVFFDNRAESLLCQLVGNHMERVKENRRKEELEEQAIKEAAAKASLSAASAPQIKKARSKLASRGQSAISSTGIGMGMGMDATSDEDNADDIDVDEDDDDASGGGAGSGASNQNRAGGGSDDREKTKHPSIRFNDGENGEDDDDEEDEDEDADFEAPEISMLRMQPPLSTVEAMSTAEAPPTSELDNHQNPAAAVVEGRSAGAHSETAQHSGHKLSTDLAMGPTASASVDTSSTVTTAKPQADEVELLLLPTSTLPDYIPVQCPVFPSPHTYKHTPVFPKREQDFFRNRMHKAEQSRQAEENLQRLISGPLVDSPGSGLPHLLPQTQTQTQTQTQMQSQSQSQIRLSAETKQDATNASTDIQLAPADSIVPADKRQARKRIQQLFPPANFRNVDKRTRLTSFIK